MTDCVPENDCMHYLSRCFIYSTCPPFLPPSSFCPLVPCTEFSTWQVKRQKLSAKIALSVCVWGLCGEASYKLSTKLELFLDFFSLFCSSVNGRSGYWIRYQEIDQICRSFFTHAMEVSTNFFFSTKKKNVFKILISTKTLHKFHNTKVSSSLSVRRRVLGYRH